MKGFLIKISGYLLLLSNIISTGCKDTGIERVPETFYDVYNKEEVNNDSGFPCLTDSDCFEGYTCSSTKICVKYEEHDSGNTPDAENIDDNDVDIGNIIDGSISDDEGEYAISDAGVIDSNRDDDTLIAEIGLGDNNNGDISDVEQEDLDGSVPDVVNDAGCTVDHWCAMLTPGKNYCNTATKVCEECICNKHCVEIFQTGWAEYTSGYGCVDNKCTEGGDAGVNVSCNDGTYIEQEVQVNKDCSDATPEPSTSSPECPEGFKFIEEGDWSTLGSTIKPPDWVDVENWSNWHYPPLDVYVSSFCMQINEVTVGEYKKCVAAGVCTEPMAMSSTWRDYYYNWDVYDNFPVIHITYLQAEAYCNWIGGRLPTECEWEKAARGPNKYQYPWGDSMPNTTDHEWCDYDNFWYSAPCNDDTCPVDVYPKGKSGYGIMNMMGNVSEYIMDVYWGGYVREQFQNKTDPVAVVKLGPSGKISHSVKGGYFDSQYERDGVDYRRDVGPDVSFHSTIDGFRCVANGATEFTEVLPPETGCPEDSKVMPDEIPLPPTIEVQTDVPGCVKWNRGIVNLAWEDTWLGCGGYRLDYYIVDTNEWIGGQIIQFDCQSGENYGHKKSKIENVTLLFHGEGNGESGKGVQVKIRLTPYWGCVGQFRVCSENYLEISFTVVDDLEGVECLSSPVSQGNINDPNPINPTYECDALWGMWNP